MVRLESMEDEMNGVVTYELRDGSRCRVPARAIREFGAERVLRDMGCGHLLPTGRVAVYRKGKIRTQYGEQVGTVPADFDPLFIKSKTFLYDPRPGDFMRDGENWVVADSLGLGDLEAIPGFAVTAAICETGD